MVQAPESVGNYSLWDGLLGRESERALKAAGTARFRAWSSKRHAPLVYVSAAERQSFASSSTCGWQGPNLPAVV